MEDFECNKENSNVARKNHWVLLRNVFGALARFRRQEARKTSLNELICEIRQIPTDKEYRIHKTRTIENSAFSTAIKDLRREQNFMKCVERGHFEDLQQIKLELNNDPYKFLRNATHPYALINKRNKDGLTPLYVACRNGNFDVVQFLMQENADYLIPSVIGNEEETNLEVAVRWSHTKIVKELLIKKWPKPTLLKAKKICNSQKILDLFKKKKKSKCLCFCRKIKN